MSGRITRDMLRRARENLRNSPRHRQQAIQHATEMMNRGSPLPRRVLQVVGPFANLDDTEFRAINRPLVVVPRRHLTRGAIRALIDEGKTQFTMSFY